MDGNMESNQTFNNLKGNIIMIPVIDNTLLKEGYAADAKVTGEELETRVKKADIVDNLVTEDAKKPLSANQGAVIKKLLDDMTESGAGSVGYNNETSGLEATNMQSAIDEVAEDIKSVSDSVDSLANEVDSFEDNYVQKNAPVQVDDGENGYGEFTKNVSTQMVDVSADGKTASVDVNAGAETVTFTDTDGNIHEIFNEKNKPFYEYAGNGSAASRTVQTGGMGRLALVYCSDYASLVTPKGALVINLGTNAITWYDSSKVFFVYGNLVIGTTNSAFNALNEDYYIQVI